MVYPISVQVMVKSKLTKAIILSIQRIGRAKLAPRLHIPKPFDENCTDKKKYLHR